MRYKFRAWDENNEVMEYGVNIDNGRPVKEGYQLYHKGNTVYHSQPMQYTGLVDVNGVEIYEGDIITSEDNFNKGKLVYRYGCFQIKYGREKYKLLINTAYPKVIGNIYQHKHLLKESEK